MTELELTALIHIVGFSTGIVLYAMLGLMTLRQRASDPRLALAAAALGLLWNSGALVIYALRDFGVDAPLAPLMTLSIAALGLLPAVVVHAAVGPLTAKGSRRFIALAAYVLSATAAIVQLLGSDVAAPSRAALLTLTIGYTVLVIVLAASVRGRPDWQRNLSAAALAAFAVSALHLAHDIAQPDSWFGAILGHHASLPLVLVILYQDYRFAFADIFLRRALSLLVLVAIAVTVHVAFATPLMRMMASSNDEQLLATAAHVALWVGTALLYPTIRGTVSRFVDRVILNRVEYRHLRDDLAFTLARSSTPNEVLERACALLGPVLGASKVSWHVRGDGPPLTHANVVLSRDVRDGATAVHVPTTDAPLYVITISGLTAGRRLLSDDVTLLEQVAAIVARRIDAVRVMEERFERDLRERDIMQLAAEAELRALRAQLNPHFLFNALTTIGYLVRAAPDRALRALYRLTDLLRAVLRPTGGDFVTLGEELDIVEAYLAIEHERFEDRLQVRIDVPAELRGARIPPLLLQPLVENAVKHGISAAKHGGSIQIAASVTSALGNDREPKLKLVVADTGVGFNAVQRSAKAATGVGLSNVRQRLERHFGQAAAFDVSDGDSGGTRVTVELPLQSVEAAAL